MSEDDSGNIKTIKCSLERFCSSKELKERIIEKTTILNHIKIELLHFINIELRINCEKRT